MALAVQGYVATGLIVLLLAIELTISILVYGGQGAAAWGISLIFGIPLSILTIYMINCLVVGNCRILSWFFIVILVIEVLLFILLLVLVSVFRNAIKSALKTSNSVEVNTTGVVSKTVTPSLPPTQSVQTAPTPQVAPFPTVNAWVAPNPNATSTTSTTSVNVSPKNKINTDHAPMVSERGVTNTQLNLPNDVFYTPEEQAEIDAMKLDSKNNYSTPQGNMSNGVLFKWASPVPVNQNSALN